MESCRRLTAVRADGRALLDRFAPYLIGGVLALQLINLPLAIVLVRALAALSSSARSRPPTVSAAGSPPTCTTASSRTWRAVDGAERRGRRAPSPELRALADASRRTTRVAAAGARGHLPAEPAARRAALRRRRSARRDVAGGRGDLDDELDELPPDTAALVYRTVQEAVRNVVGHADASRIDLRIERIDGGGLHVLVPTTAAGSSTRSPAPGHVGLALMSDLVEQAGGELAVDSAPGDGTAVRARVPVL